MADNARGHSKRFDQNNTSTLDGTESYKTSVLFGDFVKSGDMYAEKVSTFQPGIVMYII